jgi:hypothetical protein
VRGQGIAVRHHKTAKHLMLALQIKSGSCVTSMSVRPQALDAFPFSYAPKQPWEKDGAEAFQSIAADNAAASFPVSDRARTG